MIHMTLKYFKLNFYTTALHPYTLFFVENTKSFLKYKNEIKF